MDKISQLVTWENKFSKMLLESKTVTDIAREHTKQLPSILKNFPSFDRSPTLSESYAYPFPRYDAFYEKIGDVVDCYITMTSDDLTSKMLKQFKSVVVNQKFSIVGLYLALGFDLKEYPDEPFLEISIPKFVWGSLNFDTSELLLNSGVDINSPISRDLFIAKASASSMNVTWAGLVWLLEHGFDVNSRNFKGETCLHLTVDERSTRHLVSLGIDINAVDHSGFTALDRAIDDADLPKIKILTDVGATKYLPVHVTNYDVRKNRRNKMLELLDSLRIKVEFKRTN